MKLKSVGFFKEMDHGIDTEGTIMDYIDKGNKSENVDIYKYCHCDCHLMDIKCG